MMLTTPELLKEIGAAVRDLRIQRRFTRQDLATRAGVGERTLADLETGNGTRLATLVDVLRALRAIDPLMNALTAEEEISPMALLKETRSKAKPPKRVRMRGSAANSPSQSRIAPARKKSDD